MNCITCQKPLILIPAGVSRKTNRPYDAFWACPDKHIQPKVAPTTPIIPSETREPIIDQPTIPYFDKRSFRIERQHSQDMAIKFLQLLAKITPEAFMEMKKPLIDMVKVYTNYFQQDLDSEQNQED